MGSFRECEVITVHRLEGTGNLKAFVDIRIGGALVIKGCTVMEGKKGMFASMPRRLGKDGRWADVVVVSDELKGHYEQEMLKAFQDVRG